MRSSSRIRFAVPIAVAMLLVAVSCGTSVPDETVDSLRQATTAESTAPAEDPPSETDPPEDTTGDAPTGQAAGAFCERMATFAEASDDAENALGADFDPFEDDFSDAELDRFKEGFAEADALFADATAAAPPQIRDDMALMASMYSALSEKIAQADSAEELFGALFSLAFEEFDEAKIEQAGRNIEEYVQQECGFDLDAN